MSIANMSAVDDGVFQNLARFLAGGFCQSPGDVPWENLIQQAQGNRLGGLVHRLFAGLDDMPATVKDTLGKGYAQESFLTMMADQFIGPILDLLAAEEIPVLAWGGFAYRHMLYKDPAERPSKHIDFLLHPQDIKKARNSLARVGYRRVLAASDNMGTQTTSADRGFRHPQFPFQGSCVRLSLVCGRPDRQADDYEALWRRSLTPAQFRERVGDEGAGELPAGKTLRFLAPEDALVQQFIQNEIHSQDLALQPILDTALMLEHWHPDWKKLIKRTKKWDVADAGYLTLHFARELFACAVPPVALQKLRPDAARRTWLSYVIKKNFLQSNRSQSQRPSIYQYTDEKQILAWLADDLESAVGFPKMDQISELASGVPSAGQHRKH